MNNGQRITTLLDNNLRLAAQRRGLVLMKRRDKMNTPGLENGYMIFNQYTGQVVAGERYTMTPQDVRDYLNNCC